MAITRPLLFLGVGLCLWSSRADIGEIVEVSDEAVLILATAISIDSGASVEDCMRYSTNLARTLSQFSKEQQIRVMGFALPGPNNGHGNDIGGFDPSNPGDSLGTGGGKDRGGQGAK